MKRTNVLLLMILTSFFANAYEVSPIYQLLETVGDKSQSTYTIKNIEHEDIVVEVFVYGVEIINGEELLTSADKEFLVLPPQAKVKAGGYQKFRIRYLSAQALDQTKPYRVVFKQIKLNKPQQDVSEVEMLIDFSTLAYVSPPKTEAKPIAWIENDQLVIRNQGQRVLDLGQMTFEFKTEKGNESTTWERFANQAGLYLLPGYNATLSLDGELSNAQAVEIDYQP
ncbi:fimbria/pilus periplasmic chaperone [Vibrio agarivorans]|uniref:Fimbria/pilus periplasmic chaperone n=1 Tax=Vibrio agarivorans TaxID=153622 RepID=A0ABT7XZS4_9VIBR|nr:fimbria/pilus periplasmic chaperone [Vibrio agarivorans]MDN2481286.1 fimbria/pilus periplasmic chaperone [Vibrio agarivorans]